MSDPHTIQAQQTRVHLTTATTQQSLLSQRSESRKQGALVSTDAAKILQVGLSRGHGCAAAFKSQNAVASMGTKPERTAFDQDPSAIWLERRMNLASTAFQRLQQKCQDMDSPDRDLSAVSRARPGSICLDHL
ncbi:hypothetical protein ACJZ2D_004506 [Fusarium nematophilum]